jgi:hypothetical protein
MTAGGLDLLRPWPADQPKPPSPPSHSPTHQPSAPPPSLPDHRGPSAFVLLRPTVQADPRRLSVCAAAPEVPRPPPLLRYKTPPPSTINPQPLSTLNLSLKTFKTAIYAVAHFSSDADHYHRPAPSPGPYKGGTSAPEHPAPLIVPLSSSPTSEHTPIEHRPPPVIPLHRAAVSPPPELQGAHKCAHRRLLHLPRPFPGDLEPQSGRRPSSGELPRSAMAPVHGEPKAHVVHGLWT